MNFKKIISLFLLWVFVLAITPEELIHQFTGHVDTVDVFHQSQQLSTKHIHCGSLQLSLPAFTQAESTTVSFQHFKLAQLICKVESLCNHSSPLHSFGRAPPFMS